MKEKTCGHTSIGYGLDKEGKRLCYDCCTANDTKQIRESSYGDKVTHYISMNGNSVTNWPGRGLGRVIYWGKQHNFSSERHYVQVKMLDGSLWSGTGAKGMWTTLTKVKTHR
jgi:hypothetical protein